jgi:heme A synthase
VLTVCATLPLLLLGAEVTTKQVGMVDPVGLREPWHLVRVLERALNERGFLIEHLHRLVGFIVGSCAIILAVAMWRTEPRKGFRWLGFVGLAAVCVQGILGIFRVQLNALMGTNLAVVHGCFAQLVFALLVSIAWLTSQAWCTESASAHQSSWSRWSLLISALIYLQIVLGGLVRHRDLAFGARAHLVVSFAVVAGVVCLARFVLEESSDKHLRNLMFMLCALVGLQVLLGVESWMSKFSTPQWHQVQPVIAHSEIIRSIHYLVGSFVFATSVLVTLQAHRHLAWSARPAEAAVHRIGEIA